MNKITKDNIAVYNFSNLFWCRLNLVNLLNPVKNLNPVIRVPNTNFKSHSIGVAASLPRIARLLSPQRR
jgi:hypothetical protein